MIIIIAILLMEVTWFTVNGCLPPENVLIDYSIGSVMGYIIMKLIVH